MKTYGSLLRGIVHCSMYSVQDKFISLNWGSNSNIKNARHFHEAWLYPFIFEHASSHEDIKPKYFTMDESLKFNQSPNKKEYDLTIYKSRTSFEGRKDAPVAFCEIKGPKNLVNKNGKSVNKKGLLTQMENDRKKLHSLKQRLPKTAMIVIGIAWGTEQHMKYWEDNIWQDYCNNLPTPWKRVSGGTVISLGNNENCEPEFLKTFAIER